MLRVNLTFLDEARLADGLQLPTGQAHRRVGDSYRILGKSDEAEREYKAALSILGELSISYPSYPDFAQAFAQAKSGWAMLLYTTDRREQAEVALNEARSIRAKLVADFPLAAEYRQELACTFEDLGTLLERAGRNKDAEAALQKGARYLCRIGESLSDGTWIWH